MTLKSAGLYTLFTLLLLPSMQAICAEDEDNSPKPAKLFSTSETLTVTMTGPWKYIERHDKDQEAKPAKIEFTDDLGNKNTLALTVERRGITRQTARRTPATR